jgi:CRP/FNR family transcriptional regulator, cyclic AMP receptor protein
MRRWWGRLGKRNISLREVARMPPDVTSKPRVNSSDKLLVLRQHPLFRDLNPAAFDQLCRYCKTRAFKKGTVIFSKGDPGNSLFAVVRGTVRIGVSSAEGREAVFNIIGPGEIFGEIALLDGRERTADAFATTDSELLAIDRREFIPFVQSQTILAMKLIELLCTRLRWISEHVEQIVLPSLPGRLAKALIRLAEKEDKTPGAKKLSVTQLELGHMVGMSRESINKQLRAWTTRKLVRLERGSVVMLNKEALEEIALVDSESARSE